jgi:hypothetical protein
MDLNGFEFLSKPIAYRTHAGGTRDAYMEHVCHSGGERELALEVSEHMLANWSHADH